MCGSLSHTCDVLNAVVISESWWQHKKWGMLAKTQNKNIYKEFQTWHKKNTVTQSLASSWSSTSMVSKTFEAARITQKMHGCLWAGFDSDLTVRYNAMKNYVRVIINIVLFYALKTFSEPQILWPQLWKPVIYMIVIVSVSKRYKRKRTKQNKNYILLIYIEAYFDS